MLARTLRKPYRGRHGFLKVAVELLILQNETAQSAKRAKFFNFLGELRGLGGSKLLSDINLRKPWGGRKRDCHGNAQEKVPLATDAGGRQSNGRVGRDT